ncbi:MAG: hypothetical protein NZM35_02205 [Chitinophagales bacterium]|nr:hypothetical protein [Chitinophagales bacterium]MDW8418286.1 hypothetical protein [Chitinophagales bacterium]
MFFQKMILPAAWVLGCLFATAQHVPPHGPDTHRERIEALRIAFISQRLELTPAEAQKFWPVYNQYQADLQKLRENFRNTSSQPPTAEQQLDFEQKKLDLKKKYKAEFEACIGKDKVNRLYALEDEFRKTIQEFRERRHADYPGRMDPPLPPAFRPRGPQ